jgi:hypothetical protein
MRTAIIVERVLERNLNARNSDKVLFLQVWEEMGFYLSDSQRQKFLSLPSSESITRVRRKLQEQGRYPATERIKKTRELKSMIVQQNMPTASVQTAERVLEEVPDPVQTSLI